MFRKPSFDFLVRPISRFKTNYSQDMANSFYDIIISGGGMIGQTMACALSKNPIFKNVKILLIESGSRKEYHPLETYSNRVSSIVPSTKDLFCKLGMWNKISRYQEVKDMKIWGSYSYDYVHFSHDIENPAYIIENDEIINAAELNNSSSKNVEVIYGKTVRKVILNQDGNHEIYLNDNSTLKTSLLIGADGANSLIRNAMDVNYISWKYNQFGIVATLKLHENSGENTTAWQKFLPDGPIALLPLKEGLSSLVWSTTEKKAKDLLKFPEETFVDALNDVLGSEPLKNDKVDKLSSCLSFVKKNPMDSLMPPFVCFIVSGSRAMFPLSFGHSSEYTRRGVVLIGDSAHKVHPLAGQGVNIGFRDIRCLEEKLTQGIIDGRPLGDTRDLKYYETAAQRNNIPIMAATDMFHRIYTSESDIIRAFGNSCIHLAESITPIKNVMKHLAAN